MSTVSLEQQGTSLVSVKLQTATKIIQENQIDSSGKDSPPHTTLEHDTLVFECRD